MTDKKTKVEQTDSGLDYDRVVMNGEVLMLIADELHKLNERIEAMSKNMDYFASYLEERWRMHAENGD